MNLPDAPVPGGQIAGIIQAGWVKVRVIIGGASQTEWLRKK